MLELYTQNLSHQQQFEKTFGYFDEHNLTVVFPGTRIFLVGTPSDGLQTDPERGAQLPP